MCQLKRHGQGADQPLLLSKNPWVSSVYKQNNLGFWALPSHSTVPSPSSKVTLNFFFFKRRNKK